MANPEHIAILRQGVETWNRWRTEHPEVLTPDLAGSDLQQAELDQANLSEANLTDAMLFGANLRSATLVRADLRAADLRTAILWKADFTSAFLERADFHKADMHDANLRRADLTYANLREASLSGADLRDANLNGTDFTQAGVGATNFGDVDLGSSTGLENVVHNSPSTIGIDTIYKSQGKIPEKFLRGCGLPDNFIAYIGSIVGRPIEFYSCFISYSTKDQEFADRLYGDLQNKGVRCWFAPHDIKGGHKIHEQIDDAIRLHDKLLLILSEHSMNSEWVKSEIAKARKREEEENRGKDPLNRKERLSGAPKKQILFPITLVPYEAVREWECFDADSGKDSAREIREYYIPDFSSWKEHDSYQKAFQRLVGDLKAETKSAAG